VDVWTYHNDNARTGLNDRETVLTPALLRAPNDRFGELWSVPLDGQPYAQPLILTDVLVAGRGSTDLVIVATQHNSVYAFDAAGGRPGKPVWHFAGAETMPPVPSPRGGPGVVNPLNAYDIVPEVGITGTPVIDPDTRRVYVVLKSFDPKRDTKLPDGTEDLGRRYAHWLCCLDARDGRLIKRTEVAAAVPGSGTGIDLDKSEQDRPKPAYAADAGFSLEHGSSDGLGNVRFIPKCQNQRPGLLLVKSGPYATVYVGWSSHGDQGAYHGWLMGYDAQTLEQKSRFCTTPNGYAGSVWQGGAAPAADEQGNIYLTTGNGSFTARGPLFDESTDWGNSVLKISTRGRQLRVLDYFSPYDRDCLNRKDMDLGSGGVMLIPPRPVQREPYDDPLLMAVAGKDGTVFLIDRERMGQQALKTADNVFRRMKDAICEKYGLGAYFDGALYLGGGQKKRKEGSPVPSPIIKLLVADALAQHRPDLEGCPHTPVNFTDKGTTPSVSSNGPTGGVLWAIRCDNWNERTQEQFAAKGGHGAPQAVLYAFDAGTMEQLWASDRAKVALGDRIKFTVPTVANGRVYVGTGPSRDGKSPGWLTVLGVR
jgi:outer membrane protein assembly factor BamB